MPNKCDQCGKISYVSYVKLNPGIICDECEDEERKVKGVPKAWDVIKEKNKKRNYFPQNDKWLGKVLYLNAHKEAACESKMFSRIIKTAFGG